MRFWELVSVCRDEPGIVERLVDRPEWTGYLEWYRGYRDLAYQQERDKLHAELPDDLCVHMLRESRVEYYESDGHIRVRRFGQDDDRTVTAVEILQRYGGSLLEDVLEAGLARIPGS